MSALLLSGLLLLGVPVTAAADDPGTVSWSIAPATETGADGRTWIERDLDPGTTVTEHVAVRNLGDEATTFALAAADGYLTPTGRFSMLPSGTASEDAGTWVDVAESVALAPGETAVLPLTITVPADATPGDHAAGVAASVLSAGTTTEGAQVGVESRVGFRVLLRVQGALDPAVAVTDVRAAYDTSWNPFAPGAVTVEHDLADTGNTRLSVDAQVAAGGRDADPGVPVELLPGDTRTSATTVDRVWPLGPVAVTVTVDAAVSPDGEALPPVTAQVTVWAVPWPQLVVLAGVALLVGAALTGRRRRRAELARVRAEAHAAGVRDALDAAVR
jgi:hypothetical protein